MEIFFVAMVFFLIGHTVGRWNTEKGKTHHEITVGILSILDQTGQTPLEYREICDKLEVHNKKDRVLVFEELIKLADEEIICVSGELRPRRVYRKHINVLT